MPTRVSPTRPSPSSETRDGTSTEQCVQDSVKTQPCCKTQQRLPGNRTEAARLMHYLARPPLPLLSDECRVLPRRRVSRVATVAESRRLSASVKGGH